MLVLVLVLVHPSLHPPPSLAPLLSRLVHQRIVPRTTEPLNSQFSTLNSQLASFSFSLGPLYRLSFVESVVQPHLSACLHYYVGYIPPLECPYLVSASDSVYHIVPVSSLSVLADIGSFWSLEPRHRQPPRYRSWFGLRRVYPATPPPPLRMPISISLFNVLDSRKSPFYFFRSPSSPVAPSFPYVAVSFPLSRSG
ncbi:hypothetical protein OH76DRAFT_126411 [Lentinus brumalis]|uniref:Uncharacterized protein n=1 Tax=Lentinus brumalis TaxID=2498619 RepID=A0A371DJV9_9APHY|nr:hypothetical protein OH76DRAFT_126411 [Polyporus brumalis]